MMNYITKACLQFIDGVMQLAQHPHAAVSGTFEVI